MPALTPKAELPPVASPRPAAHTAQWLIVVLLAVIAMLLWTDRGSGPESPAIAQSTRLVGAGGIFAFPGQIDRDSHGLFMLDVDQGTIWCYEIITQDRTRKLQLVAARSYVFDRYLQDFNVAAPSVQMIRDLVARQSGMYRPEDVIVDSAGNLAEEPDPQTSESP